MQLSMTREQANEIRTHLEIAVSQLLQAACSTPVDDWHHKGLLALYETAHQRYLSLCDDYDVSWRDTAPSHQG